MPDLPTMQEHKDDLMRRALAKAGDNVLEAAKMLDVSKMTFYRFLAREKTCKPDRRGA